MSNSAPPPKILWLFGPPCAGKTTLAMGLHKSLTTRGERVSVLDEDELTQGINADLGPSTNDQLEGTRRTAHTAKLLSSSGQHVIITLPTPTESQRDAALTILTDQPVHWVHVDCLPEVRTERAAALGRSAEAENARAPSAHLVLKTHILTPEDCLRKLEQYFPIQSADSDSEGSETPHDPHEDHPSAKNAFSQDWEELKKLSQIRAKNERPPDLSPKPQRVPTVHAIPFWMRIAPATIFNFAFVVVGFALVGYLIWHVQKKYGSAMDTPPWPKFKGTASVTQDGVDEKRPPAPDNTPKFQSPAGPAILLPSTNSGGSIEAALGTTPPVTQPSSPDTMPAAAPQAISAATLSPRSAPQNAKDLESRAQELVQKYLAVPHWREKLSWVHDAARVEPLMSGFYEKDGGHDPKLGRHLDTTFKKLGNVNLVCLGYVGGSETPVVEVYLRQTTSDELKIDWESLTGAGEMSWKEFRKVRPAKPTLMRAVISLADYYNFEFTDYQSLLCVRLDSTAPDQRVFAYAPRTQTVGIQADSLSRLGFSKTVTVRVAFPADAQSDHTVHLLEIVSESWVLP